jgi:Ca2+-binding RTX toxin-like protein
VTPVRAGVDLVFKVGADGDQITVKNWFANGSRLYQVEQIRFDDGTTWMNAEVNAVALEVFGRAENDTLSGVAAFADTLRGGAGNDTLTAVGGGDTLDGGLGDDVLNISGVLYSGAGTTYIGGRGQDTMTGTYTGDTYVFNAGDGQDVISDYSAGYANTDVLRFASGIAADQLWFQKAGNDLQVRVIGTSDQVTVKNWYSGSQYRVEQFKTSNGQTLLDSSVQSLVDAMASFSPPPMGQTTLPQNYQDQLGGLIAANWGG